MSDLDDVVQVTITAETLAPAQANFGIPLIAAFFPPTVFPERVRSYTQTSEMVADGFLSTDPVVRAARLLLQNPSVDEFKIGRRASAPLQSIELTPNNTTEGFNVTVTVVGFDGISTVISRVNAAAETPTTIATALQPLLTAITDLTCVDNTGSVSCDPDNAGELFDFRALAGLAVLDETPDPGIVADLTAIRLEDPDWYGLSLDSNSKAEVAAAASWAEAEAIIAGFTSADEECLDDTAGNIGETLEAAAYDRSYLLWNRAVLSGGAGAWMGEVFPFDPGASTWALKTLSGITRDALTATQKNNLESNNVNHYQALASINVTRQGTMASGRFIDITRTIDALVARIQEEIFADIVNARKLPYTNASVSLVKGTLQGVLRDFKATGALDPETISVITAPLVEDVSTTDRANRLLPDVKFSDRLGGAIHKVEVIGTLSI